MKENFIKKVFQDIKVHYIAFLISIIFAVFMFFYLKNIQYERTVFVSELQMVNLDDNFIVKNISNTRIKIYIKGDKDQLGLVTEKMIKIFIDLGKVKIGDNILKVLTEDSILPENVSVYKIEPEFIKIDIDRKILKQLKIIPEIINQPEEGYVISSVYLSSNMAEVEGPKTVLEAMDSLKLKPINVAGVNSTITVAGEPLEPNLKVTVPQEIMVIVEVKKQLELIRYDDVRIEFVNGLEAFDYSVDTDALSVQILIQSSVKEKFDFSTIVLIIDLSPFSEEGEYQIVPIINTNGVFEILSIDPKLLILTVQKKQDQE